MPKTSTKKHADIALVTGATSGIGRRLVEELLKRNYSVRVLLRRHPSEHAEWRDLPRGVKIYVADITHSDEKTINSLNEACKGINILFHLAAATHNYRKRYGEEKINTDLMLNTNVVGTEKVLQAYADSNPGAKLRLVSMSTVAVYGYNRSGETLDEDSEVEPSSAYGESKYMAEQVIKAFASTHARLSYTILRMGVVYGSEYYNTDFVHVFRLLKEGKLTYVGRGTNHLTLVNIEDAVMAMMLAMDSKKGLNEIYNISDGVPYTQKQLLDMAAKFLGAKSPTKSIHPLIAKIGARTKGIGSEQLGFLLSDRIISIGKARKELGFRPSVKIEVAGKEMASKFLKKYAGKSK